VQPPVPPPSTSTPAQSAAAATTPGAGPSIALPRGFSKAARPATFGATLTVVVPGVPVPPPRPPVPPSALEAGRKLYQQRCTLCHGDTGAADGVGARRINPEPQHLDAVIWQASVTDEEITKAILEGGAAVSRSPMMPANRDLKKKPDAVQSLVAYVRSLRAPHGSVMGSLLLADQSSRAGFAAASKDGTATLVFADVPRGKAQLTVLVDGDGKVGCTLDLDVQRDATVTCK
ncbi:MAG: cytochrome c, partial [Deltaproteobacteria bacterium]|nr:cytochrome c [Deltaproteobacteria bacterium]